MENSCPCKPKARWPVTLCAVVLVLSALLAELSCDVMSESMASMAAHPIARLLAVGNALTIVP